MIKKILKEVEFAFRDSHQSSYVKAAAVKSSSSNILTGRVLVLNQSYEPISICSPKKAMILIFLFKADLVAKKRGKVVRSPSKAFPFPSVIKLSSYVRVPYRKVELSRKNIMRRDSNSCQYCGTKKGQLTIDHIIPKSRSGSDTWDNLVTACVKCNNKKGNKTPEEANLHLLKRPGKPNHILFIKQFAGKVDDNWKPFLFMD